MLFFEGPDTYKDEWMEYFVDIWAFNEDWLTQVADRYWIVPDSFQVGWLGEQIQEDNTLISVSSGEGTYGMIP